MKKVLMASSSREFLTRNTTFLRNKGFHFFTATSGVETLDLHEQHQFDLILSDLNLEDMDGCRLCAAVSKTGNPPNVPVVLICHNTADSIEQVKQSTASALLLRPIDPTHLLITIGSFIDMQLARSKRVKFAAKVSCRSPGKEFCCHSHDISISGILLETEQKLDLGSTLACRFTLPDNILLEAAVEITRFYVKPEGRHIFYGAKFIELALSYRNAINRYIISNDHLEVKQRPHDSRRMSMDTSTDFPTKVNVYSRTPL